MKNILLYGDSFFWGVDALHAGRHIYENRVGNACQRELGNNFDVVTEGLRGRTMFGNNGWFPERDGLSQFGPIFASHLPLDLVVVMLGTNDLNSKTHHQPSDIAAALDGYKQKMVFWCDFMKYPVPKVLVISPPEINQADLTAFAGVFDGAAEKIATLRESLHGYAEDHGDAFLNASEIVVSKNTDGIHLDANESGKLGVSIAAKIKETLN
jgi:lysophospholipase L1-like esterase